ncbi:Transcription factor spt20 [Serendipita sp. 399]|nr:Transcription factor spt20 [Serendipita sp. 399]
MPESRPVQTYSTLLEDRRIIEAANEANEPPSFVVHLLEKEWSIRTGRAPASPTARKFSYSDPISSLLDDIQARRIPPEFTDIFKQLNVTFFEGCLLVEMHDARPTKSGSNKSVESPEPRIDTYVLRPTPESLWADIRNVVDSQKGWGDKEALELEARVVLATAPSLCLDPSPSVNRTANIIVRSGAYPTKTSFKRRQSDDTEDDVENIKRQKMMQLMSPRAGRTFNPTYKIIAAKKAAAERKSEHVTATRAGAEAPPSNQPQPRPQVPNMNPQTALNGVMQSHMNQLTAQSTLQAQALARRNQLALKIPPDAIQAASMATQNRLLAEQQQRLAAQNAQILVMKAQQAAQVQAVQAVQVQAQVQAVQAAQVAQAAQVVQAAQAVEAAGRNSQTQPGAESAQNNNNNHNVSSDVKMETEAITQQIALQSGQTSFSLSMPPVAKRNSQQGAPSSSPPKQSATPAPMATDTPQAQPQPIIPRPESRPQTSTPQVSHNTPAMQPVAIPGLPQPVNPLASYHQGLINGQQTQLQSLVQNQGPPPPYPGLPNGYPMAGLPVQQPQLTTAQQAILQQQQNRILFNQQQQQAMHMRMSGAQSVPPMIPVHLQQQMGIPPSYQVNPQVAVPNFHQRQQQQQQQQQQQAMMAARSLQQQINSQINSQRIEQHLDSLHPEQIQAIIAKASDATRAQSWWQTASDRDKAKHLIASFQRSRILAAVNNGGIIRQ